MADDNKKQVPLQNGLAGQASAQPNAKPKPPAPDQRPDQPLKQVNED